MPPTCFQVFAVFSLSQPLLCFTNSHQATAHAKFQPRASEETDYDVNYLSESNASSSGPVCFLSFDCQNMKNWES
ncbi:hypothetical protein DL96DRAFT_1628884 [Flagelloscypha sp. PMI_526]|nr:hypothetical protein DL96DRAFT_1628884 [Flagelloscypha sp. PMI_526]